MDTWSLFTVVFMVILIVGLLVSILAGVIDGSDWTDVLENILVATFVVVVFLGVFSALSNMTPDEETPRQVELTTTEEPDLDKT